MPLKALLGLFIHKLSSQVSREAAKLKTWEGGTELFSLLPQTPRTGSLLPPPSLRKADLFPTKGARGRGKHDGVALVPSSEEQEWGMGTAESREGGRYTGKDRFR